MTDHSDLVKAAALACATTAFLTPVAILVAHRLQIFDLPGGYKAHHAPTPLLGGLSLGAGLLVAVVWSVLFAVSESASDLTAFGIGSAIIVLAGLVDDVYGLTPSRKLTWQVSAAACAGLALALLGVRLDLYLGWPPIPLILVTMLWVVGVTNAVNLMDNMNGLCAGLGVIAAACLALFNLRTGELSVALAAASLSGASLGFLGFNWPRARIFMGDTGSMLIGFSLASLSVMGVQTPGTKLPILAVLVPLLMLAIPILDAICVVVLRLRSNRSPWVGDRCHLSHRLVARGLHPVSAVAAVWLATLGCGLAALLLPTVGVNEAPLLLLLVSCLLVTLFAAAGLRGLE